MVTSHPNAPSSLDARYLRRAGRPPSATVSYPLRDSAALERIKRFIERNLTSSELSPRTICRHVGVSRSQLYRLFAGSAGVAHYILSCRLLRARTELLSSTAGVANVAHACGFSSHAHFSKVFKRHFGLTPWQWTLRGRRRARRRSDAVSAAALGTRVSAAARGTTQEQIDKTLGRSD